MASRYDEKARISALQSLDILTGGDEPHLDAVCRLAADLFDMPIALITLIDETTVWIKARHGTDAKAVPRDHAFCDRTVQIPTDDALVMHDLLRDAIYRDSPLVQDAPHARFYAGVPIRTQAGANVGTLCVLDTRPRPEFDETETKKLIDLGTIVDAHIRLNEIRTKLEKDEERFRLLAETSTDVIIQSALDTTRLYVSPAAKTVFGYEPHELVGTKPIDFVHPDDVAAYGSFLNRISDQSMETGVSCQRTRNKDGSWVWIEVSFSLTRDKAGTATGFVSALRDVTDRKRIESDLQLSQERLALAFDGGSDGLWDWNITTGDIDLLGKWPKILGYGDDEIATHIDAWKPLVHPEDATVAETFLIQHLRGHTPELECEYRFLSKSGGYIWTLMRGKVVARDAAGRATRMVGTFMDITRRKAAEAQIAHMALHDALTGLPNRALFHDRLQQEISNAKRHGGHFAVLAFDLDNFKEINDTRGHPAGDRLLQSVAEVLRSIARDGDTVARLGGDEFAIILSRIGHPKAAALVARRAIAGLEHPIEIDGQIARIGISVGIAVGLTHGETAEQIFKNADIALYLAKAEGKNTYRYFELGMDAAIAERNAFETDLRDAVRNNSFHLNYQPVHNLAQGTIEGFEALLRWTHPTRGAASPAEFVPIAEKIGLIITIGDWVLRQACMEAASWPSHLSIAVNVSTVQLQQPGLEQSVIKALAFSGLAANRLELEITESVLLHDAEAALATLHRLRVLGVRIALDDFGTGYSSLSYLRRFPFNKIKIDRAFVSDVANPDTAAIVRAVVGLGTRAGATVTAEGVETKEQLRHVKRLGCSEVQGYLFSRPLAVEDARTMIRRDVVPRATVALPAPIVPKARSCDAGLARAAR